MNRILITGAAGFIGSHIAEFYSQNENVEEIILIDNLSRMKLLEKDDKNVRFNWDYLHTLKKMKFYENDIRDFELLKRIIRDHEIDVIFHTAAQTAVTVSLTDPVADFQNNTIGTFNLLESARLSKLDPIMIFCSTNKVFGNNVNNCEVIEGKTRYSFGKKDSKGINEDFPIDLCEHTPYGTSKLCSDLYFQEYGHLYGLKTGVFRMSCIYGTRQFGVEDQGWIAHFVISALLGRKIKIFGDGKQIRDILYISDLINAYDSFIKNANRLKHDVFCMGGGLDNTISLLELLEMIHNELNHRKISYDFYDWRPSDQKVYVSDIRKAKTLLKWAPKVSPEEGVKKLLDWSKKNENLF